MENRVTLVLIVLLSFVLFFSLAETLTGNIVLSQIGSTAEHRSDLEKTKLFISPNSIKAGKIITVDIYPAKNGVFTGLAVYSASGARKYGGLCDNQASADFCSNTYQCIDNDQARCTPGPKCYGAKRINIRTSQNWSPGIYTVKVCNGLKECNKCKNPSTASFIVE
ncbi:MAG: hypothetical protein AABX29_08175 [Nanoarchaeota archaeon]